MNYETTARSIKTAEELDAAIAAGAEIEFTACGNGWDLPRYYEAASGGWILDDSPGEWRAALPFPRDSHRLRAFYPVTEDHP